MYGRSLIFLIPLIALGVWLGRVTDAHRDAYAALVESSRPITDVLTSEQRRGSGSKEIWRDELHVRVECDHSTLVFDGSHTIEQMESVRCWLEEEGEVRYMEAQRASFDYNTQAMEAEDVLLSSKTEYALADVMHFHPDEKLLVLEGRENRVLYFDREKNMQLSAPKVHAWRHRIEGVGDVKLKFGQDEFNKFQERFAWSY